MSDSVPKSASEVAEQATTAIFEHLNSQLAEDDIELHPDDRPGVLEIVAALISADRRERERWIPASTLPTTDGWYPILFRHRNGKVVQRGVDFFSVEFQQWALVQVEMLYWLPTPLPPLPGPADAKENEHE